ncbi:MAG TPA: glycosyltransferase [Conexibacter sp.]|nr:glycosyltransferase [Conexibacter sp.]
MTPAVSVVVPCFNLGPFLDEAVQSVLAQTRQDVEVLIVDDGSDDPVTQHLLASYRRPRTRILRTANRGVSAARNTGLEEARGRYVSFLDADDLFEPRFLEATIGRLEADESLAFASCWLTAFGAMQFTWEPARCDFPWLLAEDTVCTAAPVRREALLAVGGFDERPELDGYEDWAIAIALVEQGHRGAIVPERLFRYRIRPGSKTTERTGPRNHMRVFELLLDEHADSYRAHAPGVLAAIGERIAALEALLPGNPPPRPQLDGEPWRTAIPRLERHRRGLEQALEEGSPEQPAATESPVVREPRAAVEWRSLRRLQPISRVWGLDRGQPVDRFYIEGFLEAHAADIAGDVLEVKDAGYTKRFERGARSYAVLDVAEHNEQATLIADLTQAQSLPEAAFDCIVITQTLQFLFDVETAVANLHRALAPGGVVLATAPCVSRIDYEAGVDADFWRLTAASARRLFASRFGAEAVEVRALGNVLTCTAFLHGLASQDLDAAELDHHDPYFPLLLAVRAVKSGPPAGGSAAARPQAIEGSLDQATCGGVSGWAFDRAAPWRRLKLAVCDGEREVGTVWSDRHREDLAQAGKGDGRVGFQLVPNAPLHGDPPPHVRVTPVGTDAPLRGSPRVARCTCTQTASGPGPGLRGAALDVPAAGAALPFPSLEIVGWAVGEREAVEAVELAQSGEPFRRVPLDVSRPDLASAFPDCSWAPRAGFDARVNLLGTGGAVEIDVLAVLADGRRTPIGRIAGEAATPPATPVTVVLDAPDGRVEACVAALEQDAAANRVLVRGGASLFGHPGFTPAHTWSRALDEPNGFVWLSDGQDAVTPGFLAAASAALRARPEAAFAVAAAPTTQAPGDPLVGALSGTALGGALLLRASALQAVGGIDEGAGGTAQAQWDLAIRLVEAGWEHVEVPALPADGATICARAGEQAVRALYRKHARLYEPRLHAVLLERERAVGELLRTSHLAERELEEELRPQLRARRRERDRLGAKLRRGPRISVAPTDSDSRSSAEAPADIWGDLRRLEPLSPFWGDERGLCVDRLFIERFLAAHADDVHGRVLAYHDAHYATRYGRHRLRSCDVLDADATNPAATVVADLQRAPQLASDAYDCVLLPHVLQLLDEPAAALAECARVLKPGGVLLASVPAAGRVEDGGPRTDRWRFSTAGFEELLTPAFEAVTVEGHGGVDAAIAFLAGLAAEEVEQERLEGGEGEPPFVAAARAVKPGGAGS